MKIKIHKGTSEIGGSCIELTTKLTRILLDYGTPLKKGSEPVKINSSINAIVISHPHQDHFGEIVNLDSSIPIYCGKLSLELMNATKIFTGGSILKNKFVHYESWKSFNIGDFKITPYLVDHSAVDAHALLIEAEGEKILYSGDFRANGRKSKLFEKMINDDNIKDVDVLLMEGTMLQRSNEDFPDEKSVEDKIIQTIKKNNLISFMIASSQNIDSLVSAYRACKRENKIFVIDFYTAWILEKLKLVSNSTPNMGWDDVKVINDFGEIYKKKIKTNKEYFKKYYSEVSNHTIDLETIKNNPSNYFFKISSWHIEKVLHKLKIKEANIIYSQWLGYMDKEFNDKKQVKLFENLENKYNWVYAHTSGHADLDALKKFASAINAKTLIPIHTEHKNKFSEHFDKVFVLEDKEVFELQHKKSTKLNHSCKKPKGLKMKRLLKESIEKKFKESNLWINKILKDCKNENVFLALRDNRIDLYHKGGKLFTYDTNFKTHIKYASVIKKNKKNYLTESQLKEYTLVSDFESNYDRIKENCSNYSGVEAIGVAEIYHNNSYLSDKNVIILDIEVSFKSLDNNKKQDRIDLVLFNKETQVLQFVEAKHFSNKEIWSETTPKVINQISRYESQILENKSNIISEYAEYIRKLNSIFNITLPEPIHINNKVMLLIFGFDDDQKKGRLKKRIVNNNNYKDMKVYSIGNIKKIELDTLWKVS